jgi:putative membrane protein
MALRRTFLAALAVAAITPSFAQTPPQTKPAADASAAQTGFTQEQEYVRQSLAAGSLALAASRIAAAKAQMDDLREFAQLETAEQETLTDVLKSLAVQNAGLDDRTTIRRPGDAEVEQNLDQRGRETMDRLRAEPPGAEFDRTYLGALANGHLELLRIQEAWLESGRTSRADVINVAKLARGMVKEHLQLLSDIESGMEADSATTGAAPGKGR